MDGNVKHVVITGPESTGKSVLSARLSTEFDVPWVQEYARTYLEGAPGYAYSDLLAIALGQKALVQKSEKKISSKKVLIHDTDTLTILIWSRFVFGKADVALWRMWRKHTPALYVLCAPDIPWSDDPLREHPFHREELFSIYKRMIELSGVPYTIVQGEGEVRMQEGIRSVRTFIDQS